MQNPGFKFEYFSGLIKYRCQHSDIIISSGEEILRERFGNGKSLFLTGRHENFVLKPKSGVVREAVRFLIS